MQKSVDIEFISSHSALDGQIVLPMSQEELSADDFFQSVPKKLLVLSMGHQIILKYLDLWYLTLQLESRTTAPTDDSLPMHCPRCKCVCVLVLTAMHVEYACSSLIYISSGFAYSRQRVLNFYRNFPFLILLISSSHLVVLISRLGNDLVRSTHP